MEINKEWESFMRKETDMEKVRDMAINFLYLDIVPSEQFGGMFVSHPFVNSAFYPGSDGKIGNLLEDEGLYEKFLEEKREKIGSIERYREFDFLIEKPYRMAFLKYTYEYLSEKDLADYLKDAWILSENPNSDVNVTVSELKKFFRNADKEVLMDERERDLLKSLPGEVEVFRGITKKRGKVQALSWTLDAGKAEWFANRFSSKGEVYRAKISKEDIYAVFLSRGEQEVVLNPVKLRDIELTVNFGALDMQIEKAQGVLGKSMHVSGNGRGLQGKGDKIRE